MDSKSILFNPATQVLRKGWRIPWLILWVAPVFIALRLLAIGVWTRLPAPMVKPAKSTAALASILVVLWIYRLFARKVEHRIPSEIKVDRDTPWHVGLGFLMGGGVMLIIVGTLAMAGCYRVEAFNSPWTLLRAVVFYLPQTFIEDFVFGLVLYRLLREGLGMRTALILAPFLFAAAHTGNDHESLLGLAEIFTAGTVLYYAFERTGRFWTIWALHFSWNFIMNGILGMANSGQDLSGFIKPAITGPAWLTGGATGPEASVLAVGMDLLVLFLLWKMPDRCLRSRAI